MEASREMANSKKRCRNCKSYKLTESMININGAYFCNINGATTYAFKNKEKGKKIKHVAQKKNFQLSDTKKQHGLTQPVYNRLRVLEELEWFKSQGLEPECISCAKKNMDWCCGHFKTRGAQGNLRYDKNNTFLQCNRYCNMGLSGNISGDKNTRGYIQGLFDRFGDKRAQEIIDYCETETAPRKFTGLELEAMRKEFNKQIKMLE